ncbi:MAG: FtsX-like permease family protein [Pirellulaceae bacterium]
MTASSRGSLTSWRFVVRSLEHHWRADLAIALGVAAATAVLTGALLVGDSVRGSLRTLTLDRLGTIDEVLVTDRFFRIGLVDQLVDNERFGEFFASATPAILFPRGTVERQGAGAAGRAASVLIMGCDTSFWSLGDENVGPTPLPGDRQIVLNQPLADDLQVSVGDKVVLRLPRAEPVPAESPFANKSDRIRSLGGLEVVDIIPAKSLGQFRLRASQTLPRNAFVSLETIQLALNQEGKVNAILVEGNEGLQDNRERSLAASRTLAQLLRPSFEDHGFALKRVRQSFAAIENESPQVIFDYVSLTTDRMIFSREAEQAAARAYAADLAQPLFTYLANAIEKRPAETSNGAENESSKAVNDPAGVSGNVVIPYSTVAAIDPSGSFALRDLEGNPIGPLDDDEIVLHDWAANRLHARPGDRLRISYFEPETTHGAAVEQHAEFTLKAVTPLTEPSQPYHRNRAAVYDKPPTPANDPDLTPEVKGVTDQETIDDWDPPFPFDRSLVTDPDEEYWDHHRTTPKAFISLAAGRRLWTSRFGTATSFRIPVTEEVPDEELKQKLIRQMIRDGTTLGFDFQPIKRRQLEASEGTTPFDVLFLALSFFVIAAALLLVALLFRLGIEQRAGEVGTLLAVGLRRTYVAWLMLLEGALVSAFGGVVGVGIGVAYAQLMLSGLRSWWVGAITTPFLQFHYTEMSLGLGYALGVFVSLATIGLSILGTRRIPVGRLLAGRTASAGDVVYKTQRITQAVAVLLVLAAIGLLVMAVRLTGMEQGGAFVGGGAALLAGMLLLIWVQLKRGGAARASTRMSLLSLAVRNAARNPGRSAATIGLMSTACFLVVAMSSFRLDPSASGAGGFDLVAESSQAIFEDLNDSRVRTDLLADGAETLDGGLVFGSRLRGGDDASCNNLYRPSQPRVIGVTPQFVEYFDDPAVQSFSWTSTAAESFEEQENPWRLLLEPAGTSDDAIPVVIDLNTATYSLKPTVGVGDIYKATYDNETVRFRVVGLLENSLLQGSLVIGEGNFQTCFPDVQGYRYFLIKSPTGKSRHVTDVLEDRLGDQGLDVIETYAVLEQLLAVQNTYLSTFQSLGALGLLLGTFGLATVQLRNVLERRSELALLRAAGFRRRRLASLVLAENTFLLLAGLLTGVVAALVAVLPHKLVGGAAFSASLLMDLATMLGIVLVVGLAASLMTIRATLRAPILEALRGE